MDEFRNLTDEELFKIARGEPAEGDFSGLSDEELFKIAGIEKTKKPSLASLTTPETSQLETVGRAGLRGATLGFSEKIAPYIAGGVAKIGGGEATRDIPYSELVEEARGIGKKEIQKAQEEYPKTFFASEMAGGVLGPLSVLGAKGAKAIGGVKGIVGAGAAEGAVAGAGYSEDLGDVPQTLQDIKEGAFFGAGFGLGFAGLTKAGKLALKPLAPAFSRIMPKGTAKKELISSLKKEGITPQKARESLQKMQDEGIALIDVLDQRSSVISRIPEKVFEKKPIGVIDNYVRDLNIAGNKAKREILDLVSKKKISSTEGAEILGQNAQEVINRQKKLRSTKAKPLYEKAFEKGDNILPADDEILQRPVVRDAIEKAKTESEKFGGEIVGSVSGKTDNSLQVLHQAKDYLYRKSKDFTDLESARYGQVYNELSEKLKKASPEYREATKIWAGETKGIEKLYKQKGIGNIARKYEKQDIDGIRSSLKNVFKKTVSDEEIARLKNILPPEDFGAIVRKDLENVIVIDKSGSLTTSLFGKGEAERSLANKRLDLVFDPVQKRGLKRTTEIIDRVTKREKELGEIKFKTEKQRLDYIYGGKYGVINSILKLGNLISESPREREAFTEFLFTPQGAEVLQSIAKSPSKQAEQIIARIVPAILTQTQQETE